jgi:hypothetical protein
VRLAHSHRASEPGGQAGEHHRRALAEVGDRCARRAVECSPDQLGLHAAVAVALLLARRPASAEQQALAGHVGRKDLHPVIRLAPRPTNEARGEGVILGPALEATLDGRGDLRVFHGLGHVEEQLGRPALGNQRFTVAELHALAVAHHIERALERRRRAQRHLHLLRAHQLRQPPARVAAVG